MANEPADVLIIGSGASGGPFAWHLSKAGGIKIVCLEQGDWAGPPPSPGGADAAQQKQRLVSAPPPRAGVRYFKDGYPYDHSESYWQPVLGNAVGGATVHYEAVWCRLRPSDFVVRSLDGVADDWPIRYWDLQPYYDLNDRMVGISGVAGNPSFPPRSNPLLPAIKLSRAGEILSGGFEKLGWHWWPADRAIITVPHGGRQPCTCSSCSEGCPRGAKNSSDVVFWPEAIRNGVVLKSRCRVREIVVDRRGLAKGVLYYDADGRLQEQQARIVVLACNGIGTPRILLTSKSSRYPRGLANSSGLVGRNLMSHPMANVVGLLENIGPDSGVAGTNYLTSDQFCESDPKRGFVRGFQWLSGGVSGPIDAALGTPPGPGAPAVDAVPVAWGRKHHAAFQQRYNRTVTVMISADELPEEANRVELHPDLTDDTGIPAPKLIYRRGENTEKILDFAIERSKQLLEAAGATKIVSATRGRAAPGHYCGTARMGEDPQRSVVDKWCRAHDVRNLFIIDGSVFTTIGANSGPTSTIQAIALRTADYIRDNARTLLS